LIGAGPLRICRLRAVRDTRRVLHAVRVDGRALCGTTPGRRAEWVVDGAEVPTCPRCAARAALPKNRRTVGTSGWGLENEALGTIADAFAKVAAVADAKVAALPGYWICATCRARKSAHRGRRLTCPASAPIPPAPGAVFVPVVDHGPVNIGRIE
jgi:hypothetical protein